MLFRGSGSRRSSDRSLAAASKGRKRDGTRAARRSSPPSKAAPELADMCSVVTSPSSMERSTTRRSDAAGCVESTASYVRLCGQGCLRLTICISRLYQPFGVLDA